MVVGGIFCIASMTSDSGIGSQPPAIATVLYSSAEIASAAPGASGSPPAASSTTGITAIRLIWMVLIERTACDFTSR